MTINALQYFEAGALKEHRDKVGVVDPSRGYTFGEIGLLAKNCAALILERSIEFNQPVAVFLPKSVLTIVADLGVLYSGNCYANLDVNSPRQRLKATLGNLGSTILITSVEHAGVLRELGVPEEQLILITTAMSSEVSHDEGVLLARLERIIDTDPICIIHTSGSTGIPKGVALSHRNTIDFMDWVFERLALDGTEVIGSLSPFYFDIFTLELFLCVAKGATLVIIPDVHAAFPVRLLQFMQLHAVNFIFWVPTIMVNIANQQLLEKYTLDSLRKILFAGEVFPTKQLNYWRRHLPRAQFVNLYGPIEISVDCTYFIVDRDMADDEKLPIGFPCRNTDVLVLNEENQPVRMDEPGELCVRGSSIALGYWNDAERTARAFVQNPLNTHYPERIYRTGDLVYRNARGELMITGRKDFQIKHRGYRIELGEIEHAALRLDTMSNVCAVYSHTKKEIVLYFESSTEVSPGAVREGLSAYLPTYMLPAVCHRIDQLPRNPNGKIDRQLLTSRVA